jgi:MFS family permease
MILGVTGQVGLWGVGFWTPELIRSALLEQRRGAVESRWLRPAPTGASDRVAPRDLDDLARSALSGRDQAEAKALAAQWRRENDTYVGWGTVLQDVAGMAGIFAFTLFTARVGRRWAFALSFLLALGATLLTFGFLSGATDVFWMVPLLGFANSSVYGGFAIYFPELYPTRLRSTGTGFCYNVARYLTALGPLTLGKLTLVFGAMGYAVPLRPAAICVAMIYLVGVFTVPFAPETKGKPLPE